MKYEITYTTETYPTPHTRCYRALTKATALEMFKETCNHGALIGEKPSVIKVKKISEQASAGSGR